MKPITEPKMKILRYAYTILLCLVIAVLFSLNLFTHEWIVYVFIVIGLVLGFVIEDYLKKKFPETFPKSENEKKAEQLVKDIEEGKLDDDTIKLPRTLFGTLSEIIAVGIIGYALYRAWTLDQRIWSIIGLSAISIFALFASYITDIKKKDYDSSHIGAYEAMGNRGHVSAIIAALLALLLTYFTDPEAYYRWRPLVFLCGLFIALRIPVQHILYKRSAALMAQVNNYNPGNVRVARTLEGTAFETATVLMLIGGWCAAAIKHQLTGCGILDIPLADLIVCSVFSIALLILAYFPTWMNGAAIFKSDKQVLDSIRRCRISAVVLALFALILPFILPDLDERTLGYLYVALLILISICSYFIKFGRENNPTNNDKGYETEQ